MMSWNSEIDKPVVQDDEGLVRVHAASANPYHWHFMRGLSYMSRIATGLLKPRYRTYPLSEVPEAIRYLEEGHTQGKVVITVDDNGKIQHDTATRGV